MKKDFLELGMGIVLLFAVFFMAREGAAMVFMPHPDSRWGQGETEEGEENRREKEKEQEQKKEEQEKNRGQKREEQEKDREQKKEEQEKDRGQKKEEQEKDRGQKKEEQEKNRGQKREEQEKDREQKKEEQEKDRGQKREEQEKDRGQKKEEHQKDRGEEMVVVVDPGHGGSDPGKIGIHQEKEKEINLQVGFLVKEELEKEGISVVMTRERDEDLAGEGEGSRKARDLKNRCALIDSVTPVCGVSIHQNSYHQENVCGAQTFYYANSKEGKVLGEAIQECLIRELDRENHRMAKGNASYYMLKKTVAPLVIVECGFLSNEKEASLLGQEDYQKKVAHAICEGVFSYINQEKSGEEDRKVSYRR